MKTLKNILLSVMVVVVLSLCSCICSNDRGGEW